MKYKFLILMFALTLLVSTVSADIVQYSTSDSTILADARLFQDLPATNDGSGVILAMRDEVISANGRRTYLMTANTIPKGSTVHWANLTIHPNLVEVDSTPVSIVEVFMNQTGNTWHEVDPSGITYSNQYCGEAFENPHRCILTVLDQITSASAGVNASFDVTVGVQNQVNRGDDNLSYVLLGNGSNGGSEFQFRSKEHATLHEQWTLTINFTAPVPSDFPVNVTIITPQQNQTLNPAGNLLPYEYSFGFSDPDSGFGNASLFINGTLNQTIFTADNQSFIIGDGTYTLNITAFDNESNFGSAVVEIFKVDSTPPDITITAPTEAQEFNKFIQNVTFDALCTDSNLLDHFNVSLLQGSTSFFDAENLTIANSLTLSGTVDISGFTAGSYSMNYTCADTHTATDIKPYKVTERKSDKRLSFEKGREVITINSEDFETSFYVNKQSDRYVFGYPEIDAQGTYTFIVASTQPIKIIEGSGYKGHMVTGSRWIDFMNDDSDSKVTIARLSETSVRVTVIGDNLLFHSIGDLNVFSEGVNFVIDDTPLSIDWLETDGTNYSQDDLTLLLGDLYTLNDLQASLVTDGSTALCDLFLNNTFLYSLGTLDVSDGIGVWRFEEGNGTTALDSSGNGNTGVISGATYVASSGTNETGNFSLDFDGASDLVIVEDSVDGDFTFGDSVTDSPFSVGAWINMDDATGFRVVTKRESNTDIEWGFFTDSSDFLNFQIQDDENGHRQARRTAAITSLEGTWVHVVGTYDGTSSSAGLNIYIDGVISDIADDNDGSYVAMHNEGIDLHIGALNTVSVADGKIDQVFVAGFELTQEQIQAIIDQDVNSTPAVPLLTSILDIDDVEPLNVTNVSNTYEATITCTSDLFPFNVSDTYLFNTQFINVTVPEPIVEPEGVSFAQCVFTDAPTGTYVFVMFIFVLALAMMVGSHLIKNAIVGTLGAAVLLIGSFFLWFCYALIALVLTFTAFWMMYYFLTKGFKGEL